MEIKSFKKDFFKLCRELPDEKMIIYDTGYMAKEYTYYEVGNIVRRYLQLFHEKNMKKGDVIISLLPNSAEAILLFFAAMAGGYIFAPLPCNASEREIERWDTLILPRIIFGKTNKDEDKIPANESYSYFLECDGNFQWLPQEEYNDILDADESATLYLFTSGTTGEPKAMKIDGNKLWSSAQAFSEYHNLSSKQLRFWNYLPMSYLGGLYNLALIPLCTCGSFVITEPFSGKSLLSFWDVVKRRKIDALWFVPTIINGLLTISKMTGRHYKEFGKEVLKIAFLGTAPIDKDTKEEFEIEFGVQLFENFALSETTFLTSENKDNIRFRQQGSVGAFLPYVKYKLKPYGEVENIWKVWVKTPYLFEGYMDQEGKLTLELDADGYFDTKDLAILNEDHQLVLKGRERDIIKKGGLFVSLIEVEQVVKQIQGVKEAAAVAIKHKFYGESYSLFLIAENLSTEAVRQWLLHNLVSYKLPEEIIILKEFPKTASGKVMKKELLKCSKNLIEKNIN